MFHFQVELRVVDRVHLNLFTLIFGVLLDIKVYLVIHIFVIFVDDFSCMTWLFLLKD